jgi:23S rRNA (cytidine1920-2'-O)/16S rRNA (cytidine1409-2'-O)-methyltransferase
MKEKIRLDALLVLRGLAVNRARAKAFIMAGKVFSGNEKLDKPGRQCSPDIPLDVRAQPMPYVSRGGQKLAKAVEEFALDFTGAIVADFGASTGGFTDCALQNGARRVYAIDVGYGQLAWRLRQDDRVLCVERTNARYLTEDSLGEKISIAVCDVSFISVTKMLPALRSVLIKEGQAVILIKPQFEAGRRHVGKKGVVKDPRVHAAVIQKVLTAALSEGFKVRGLTYSPLRGPEGNSEYLAWLSRDPKAEVARLERLAAARTATTYAWTLTAALEAAAAEAETAEAAAAEAETAEAETAEAAEQTEQPGEDAGLEQIDEEAIFAPPEPPDEEAVFAPPAPTLTAEILAAVEVVVAEALRLE